MQHRRRRRFPLPGRFAGPESSATTEKVEVDSSDAPVAETLVSITKKVTRAFKMTLRNVSSANLALFVMGTASTVTQTATGGATSIASVVPGRYYKIGGTTVFGLTIAATGVKTGTTASGTVVTGTKWEYDGSAGLLYFTTGSAATGAHYVVYTKTATTHSKVESNTTGALKGTLLFVSDNTEGSEDVWKISRCEIAPDGEAALKSRDNPVELAFAVNVLTRDSVTPQVTINGQAVSY